MEERVRRLSGRVALVVGGASDLGRAVARRLAAEGAAVSVADARPQAASETCRLAEAAGGRARLIRAAPARLPDAARMVAETVDFFGRLDILFAAVLPAGKGGVADVEAEAWEQEVAAALQGVVLVSKHAVPAMRRSGGGSVVFAVPGAEHRLLGELAVPSSVGAAVAQGAVVGLARSMAAAHGPEGIRVNCVCVGPTGAPSAAEKALEAAASAVLFLASEESSLVTGAVLSVGGGQGVSL